jgi:hypothetical protein
MSVAERDYGRCRTSASERERRAYCCAVSANLALRDEGDQLTGLISHQLPTGVADPQLDETLPGFGGMLFSFRTKLGQLGERSLSVSS